jgi:hypothetical protein
MIAPPKPPANAVRANWFLKKKVNGEEIDLDDPIAELPPLIGKRGR